MTLEIASDKFDEVELMSLSESGHDNRAKLTLFNRITELSQYFGFEYCSFGMRASVPVLHPKGLSLSNYPALWQENYYDRKYIEIDPVIQRVMPANASLIWDLDSYSATPELRDELRAQGIICGLTQSFHIGAGITSLFTIASSSQQMNSELVKSKKDLLGQFAQAAYAGISKFFLSELAPDQGVDLTIREKEVLRWTADGKTAFEISKILNVATRTINFHLSNVIIKLNAANKTQAAVKAVAFGLIL